MNANHAQLCSSPEWAAYIQDDLLPLIAAGVDLGEEMLEIGPGPGAATDWLRHKVRRLTALELDAEAAEKLAARYSDTNVEVITGSAAEMTFADESFDSVGAFTMLHHIPTLSLQDKILAEVFRVLRPAGVLIASDSLASTELHDFHVGDTYNPIEPSSLLPRLQSVGFAKITIVVDGRLSFIAHKAGAGTGCGREAPADD
jgi:ubiquinone/menaquinone biosynthesis C-methylase UbiE